MSACIYKADFVEAALVPEQSAFLTLFVRDCLIHEQYNLICPIFLMQVRRDGRTGFFGGSIEKGEDIAAGVRREFLEETGVEFMEAITLVSSYLAVYTNRVRASHFFAAEVSLDFFMDVMRQAASCIRDNIFETSGVRAVIADPFGRNKCVDHLLQSPLPDTTGEHVLDFLDHYNLMPPRRFAQIANAFKARP